MGGSYERRARRRRKARRTATDSLLNPRGEPHDTRHLPARRARGAPRDRRRTALPPPRPGRGLRHARRGAAARAADHGDRRRGRGARARRREPARRARPALRRRGARRREAEPHPQRERPRRRGLEAADPRLLRRAGPLVAGGATRSAPRSTSRTRTSADARPRRTPHSRSRRGLAQGDVWDEVREKAVADVRPLADRREPRHVPRARAATASARGGVPGQARAVRRPARDRRRPLRRRRLPAGRLRAPVAEAPRRLPARRARASRRPRDVRRADLRPRGVVGGASATAARRSGSATTCACAARTSSAPGSSSTAS